ncbi:MAG: hypothetical protein R3C59_20565 [Planctomycetaceae bacterium]
MFTALCVGCSLFAGATSIAQEPFRPEPGKFPPQDKAKSYTGELTFVDHANRRGSLRTRSDEPFYSRAATPIALLPYCVVRYRGAPADLRDIPLGSILHGRFYLPPEPQLSSVPTSRQLANHAALLEDEPSFCLREGLVWKLQEVKWEDYQWLVTARREAKDGKAGKGELETMTVDAATRIWRGRESLLLQDLIDEGMWPEKGKKSFDDQAVLLGLRWKPTRGTRFGQKDGTFNRWHIGDIWLDEESIQRAARQQTEEHKTLIRTRWMPALVDQVVYGKAGQATVIATLIDGMDESLYADFKQGVRGQMSPVATNLKHGIGDIGHYHTSIDGTIVDVSRLDNEAHLGSSGIQIRMKVGMVLEGFRAGGVVRIRPMSWPDPPVPREEYITEIEDRFPSPDIFPNYRSGRP